MDKAYLFGKENSSYRDYLNKRYKKNQKTTAGKKRYGGLLAVVFCMFAIPLGLSFLFAKEPGGYDVSGHGETSGAGSYGYTPETGTGVTGTDTNAVSATAPDEDYYVSCVRETGDISVPMNEYLVSELVRTMDPQSQEEALRAMAVLLRTQVVHEAETHGGYRARTLKTTEELKQELGAEEEAFLLSCMAAVRDTTGIIMTYEGEAAELTYHLVSAGSTRDGSVIFGDRYPYLCAAACEEDLLSPDYRSVVTFSQREFFEKLRQLTGKSNMTDAEIVIEERDEAGYVLSLSICGEGFDSVKIGGETFRMIFDLPSANFSIEEREREIAFVCNGNGHGFGMSLYQAERLAEGGSSFMEILNYFFTDMTFMRIA